MTEVEDVFVRPEDSLKAVMQTIDEGALGIALVVNQKRQLLATITDGDIRRGILGGQKLDATVQDLLEGRDWGPEETPVTAPASTSSAKQRRLLKRYDLRHLPLVDNDQRVVDLATLKDLVVSDETEVQAVVMAGGYGTRLRPLTEETPKPMLPVGERPLMEHILERLSRSGIQKVNITTHYLEDRIREHFDDGSDFGMDIDYVSEAQPLGTAGALSLLDNVNEPLLVINGDILTTVDFRALATFHQEQSADLTVGVRHYEMEVPYGVVETSGTEVTGLQEKPSMGFYINTGIYLLEPRLCKHIEPGEQLDMTDLIDRILERGGHVVSFPIVEYWLDIGEQADYRQARRDVERGRVGRTEKGERPE